MPIYTDRTTEANRLDIVLKNKKDKTCLLIDMTIPLDTNTSVKTTEKLNKYKDLEIEVERMWGLKTTTVRVVMGALGTIKKDMENYSTKIPGSINIHELEKITLLSIVHLLKQVLSIKSKPSLLPKSMVWIQMLREEITRNYTIISYIIIKIR